MAVAWLHFIELILRKSANGWFERFSFVQNHSKSESFSVFTRRPMMCFDAAMRQSVIFTGGHGKARTTKKWLSLKRRWLVFMASSQSTPDPCLLNSPEKKSRSPARQRFLQAAGKPSSAAEAGLLA